MVVVSRSDGDFNPALLKGESMDIGFINFSDGDCEQGWNPALISPEVRNQVAGMLEEIAAHMRNDEFAEGEQYVKRPFGWLESQD